MVFQPGNKLAEKLTTPERKKEVYAAYCAWIARGKSKKSFSYVSPEFSCIYKTVEKYMKEEPDVFPPVQVEIATSKGYAYWEQVVEDSAIGNNEKANTASLQMKMRNAFGWDKKEEVVEHSEAVDRVTASANFVVDEGKKLTQSPSSEAKVPSSHTD